MAIVIVPDWDERLTRRRIQLTQYDAQPGEMYFRLIRARFLDVAESRGLHHIFVDVVDEAGKRMVGVPVTFLWGNGAQTKLTEQKPGEPQAVDFPMYASGYSYSVRIQGPGSDSVSGMGLGTLDNHFAGEHTSFHLTFQLARGEGIEPEPVPPAGDTDWQKVLTQAELIAAIARRKLNPAQSSRMADPADLIPEARREVLAKRELTLILAAISGATVSTEQWTEVAEVALGDPTYRFSLCVRMREGNIT